MKKIKLHWIDAEELAKVACGLDEESGSELIEDALFDKFDCSFETFHKIAESLLPLTPAVKTMMSDKLFHGFVKDDCFIVKEEVEL